MNQARQTWAAFSILALLLAVIGIFVVPAHSVSIWMDREFTDWISPVANRLSAHSRLYADGLHSPMPPLPFVLVHLLWPHGALWIDESRLYFLFQAGLVLMLFLAFSKQIGPATTFICALIVLPVYLSFGKTILYDALTQFFVAACGITAAAIIGPQPRPKCRQALAILLGFLLALLLLTKQNTFGGATLGVCAALVFLPRAEPFRHRLAALLVVLLSSGIFFCLLSLALRRWVSFSGMIYDVFITGSEPKGGAAFLVWHLLHFCAQVALAAGGWSCGLVLLYWAARRCRPGLDYVALLDGCISPNRSRESGRGFLSIIFWSVLLFLAAFLAVYLYARTPIQPLLFIWLNHCRKLLLTLGLTLACFFAACVVLRKFSPRDRDWGSRPLAVYAIIFFFAALFHSLSVSNFRWSSDNNPLVFSALAFVVSGSITVCHIPALSSLFGFNRVRLVWLGVYMLLFWAGADTQMYLTTNCTESWPEVKHLAHARLRPQSAGLRSLVDTVRSESDPAGHETVLLLPNDPNLEAWFDRERPPLTSAIIFPDQYWDRYVDQDLARLKALPPKVIVIGPRNYWLNFSKQWKENRGAERLINSIKAEILPKNYDLVAEKPINFRGGKDFMDVYVRRDR